MVMPLPTSGRSTCTFPSFAAAERERSALPLAREGKREWSCLSLHLSDDATLEYREQNHSMGTGERCTRGGERTERARAPHKVPSRYPAYVAPLPIERGLSVPQSSRSATSLTRALSPHRKKLLPSLLLRLDTALPTARGEEREWTCLSLHLSSSPCFFSRDPAG